jgi:Protein of unknown function (DUF1559)
MLCPSAGTSAVSYYNDDDEGSSGMAFGGLTKGNYAACFGGRNMLQAIPPDSVIPPAAANIYPHMAGAFGMARIQKFPVGARLGRGIGVAKIGDGMSKTVFLSEVLTWNEENEAGTGEEGLPGNDDWRGVWMIPSVGASAFTGRFPPNSSEPDLIPACGTGIENSSAFREMPCKEEQDGAGNTWASARSAHSGGVNAATGDGAVAFIANDIDQLIWQAMCTRAGGDISQ